jgi:hypothetical protein
MNIEEFGKNASQSILMYAGIYLNGLRNTTRTLIMEVSIQKWHLSNESQKQYRLS